MKYTTLLKRCLLMACLMIASIAANATTKYVTPTGVDGPNAFSDAGGHDGNSWAQAYATVDFAILRSPSGNNAVTDTILMESGTYYTVNYWPGNGNGAVILMPAKIYIKGSLSGTNHDVYDPVGKPTVISFNYSTGNNGFSVSASSQLVTFIGLQIKDKYNSNGTAISLRYINMGGMNDGSVVTMQDVLFSNDFRAMDIMSSYTSGGYFIGAIGATINIINTVVDNSTQESWLVTNEGNINVINSHFRGGSQTTNGLLWVEGQRSATPSTFKTTNLTVRGSTFCNARGYPGLYTSLAVGKISSSSFTANNAPRAGGLFIDYSSDIKLDSVIFYANTANYNDGFGGLQTSKGADIMAGDVNCKFSSIKNSYLQLAGVANYNIYAVNNAAPAGMYVFGTGNVFNNISTNVASVQDPNGCPSGLLASAAFNCGSGGLIAGNFIAGTASNGTLRVPITNPIAGNISFTVTGTNISSIPATYTTVITAASTYVDIPVSYTGGGAAGIRTLTITSTFGTGSCSIDVAIGAACAATSGTLQ